ncbi:MAG: hypothetical protein WA741_29865 [Candidatus Sulfotelmatobacter sp.]
MKRLGLEYWIHHLLLVATTLVGATSLRAQEYVRDSEPTLFTYDELVQLSIDQPLTAELAEKLHTLTTTPFINNEAYFAGARPRPLDVKGLGPTLRIACWNIERGLELDDIQLFLTDRDRFMAKVEEERKRAKDSGAVALQRIPEGIEILQAADVWIWAKRIGA